jgi:hypothetical protein
MEVRASTVLHPGSQSRSRAPPLALLMFISFACAGSHVQRWWPPDAAHPTIFSRTQIQSQPQPPPVAVAREAPGGWRPLSGCGRGGPVPGRSSEGAAARACVGGAHTGAPAPTQAQSPPPHHTTTGARPVRRDRVNATGADARARVGVTRPDDMPGQQGGDTTPALTYPASPTRPRPRSEDSLAQPVPVAGASPGYPTTQPSRPCRPCDKPRTAALPPVYPALPHDAAPT